MIALNRKATKVEFDDTFVQSDAMQAMQRRIETRFDPEIEALGFDRMRSIIEIRCKDDRSLESAADERYRGGPDKPLSDSELEAKARGCCEGALTPAGTQKVIDTCWSILTLADAAELATLIQTDS